MRQMLQAVGITFAFSIILCSCISRPSGYEGYMTKPYTVRGESYQPMSVKVRGH